MDDPHKASLEIPDFLKPGRGGRSDGDEQAEGKTGKDRKGGGDKDSKHRS